MPPASTTTTSSVRRRIGPRRYAITARPPGPAAAAARRRGPAKQALHRRLNLPLARRAKSGDRLLDRRRGKRGHLNRQLRSRETDNPPNVAHEDRRPRIALRRVEVLDGDLRGTALLEEGEESPVDALETIGQRSVVLGADETMRDELDSPREALQKCITGRPQPWIDAEYHHARTCVRPTACVILPAAESRRGCRSSRRHAGRRRALPAPPSGAAPAEHLSPPRAPWISAPS